MKRFEPFDKILLLIIYCLLVTTLSGCIITKIATKEDVGTIQKSQVSLSEQILLLKDEASKIHGSVRKR